MQLRNKHRWPVLGAIALAVAVVSVTSPADAAPRRGKNTPPAVVNAVAPPPLPAVRTTVEPGAVQVDKLNARVKDKAKRKRLANADRQKYGLASRDETRHARRSRR
jgi:hypothetical protein